MSAKQDDSGSGKNIEIEGGEDLPPDLVLAILAAVDAYERENGSAEAQGQG